MLQIRSGMTHGMEESCKQPCDLHRTLMLCMELIDPGRVSRSLEAPASLAWAFGE